MRILCQTIAKIDDKMVDEIILVRCNSIYERKLLTHAMIMHT